MNEKKSNSALVAIVAIVAIFVLAVPCLLGALFFGGVFLWKVQVQPMAPPMQEIIEPQPSPVPKPQVEP